MPVNRNTRRHTARAARALSDLVGESVRLHGRLLAASDRMSRDLGLSGARWQLMSVLGRSSAPITASEAARWMGLARQSVQRVADALAAEGLLEYLPNPGHRRAQHARLTLQGRSLLERLDRRRYRWADEVAADLNAAELEAAVRVLATVRRRLGG
jgi:DNA-binding MarR family transcriptional regulator